MKVFVFVHGYGSGPEDFADLPSEVSKHGFHVDHFKLPGHDDYSDDYLRPDLKKYEKELLRHIQNLKNEGHEVYLVGFSLGATLSISVEQKIEVSGIILFGVFLGTTPTKHLITYTLNQLCPSKTFKRKVSVTKKREFETPVIRRKISSYWGC